MLTTSPLDSARWDVREMKALSGSRPLDALMRGVRESTKCFTITDGVFPVGMFGAAPLFDTSDEGCVWLLGTDQLTKHGIQFLRESRKWVSELHKDFAILKNFVLADNHVHIRWLNWIEVNWIPYNFQINGHTVLSFNHVRTN
jgi:hypothetical protein